MSLYGPGEFNGAAFLVGLACLLCGAEIRWRGVYRASRVMVRIGDCLGVLAICFALVALAPLGTAR